MSHDITYAKNVVDISTSESRRFCLSLSAKKCLRSLSAWEKSVCLLCFRLHLAKTPSGDSTGDRSSESITAFGFRLYPKSTTNKVCIYSPDQNDKHCCRLIVVLFVLVDVVVVVVCHRSVAITIIDVNTCR